MPNVTADMVKQLRDMTGAGMMDCKKALEERGGDLEAAKDWLREKGLARAASKSGRATNEGTVEAYVHSSGGVNRLGVLVEVNCESDFVARTDDFKALAKELALQIAGASPKYVSRDQVPAEELERERAIYRTQVEGKPPEMVEKIVEGKLEAYFSEVCLLDQPYIRDEKHKKKVSDLVAETVAKLGENISVARFSRLALGEAIEATSTDSNHE